jgi:DNA-binding MarR family transcriptional regulator
MDKTILSAGRVPDAQSIAMFRDRPGVWLSFAGSAFLSLYAEELGPLEMKPGWVTAMAIIAERPGITQSALARALRINRASSMALAATLESLGYISRKAAPGRNQVQLGLLALGQARLENACAVEDNLTARIFGCLSDDELPAFVTILKRIAADANSFTNA